MSTVVAPQSLPQVFDAIRRDLEAHFLDKAAIIRLLMVATVSGENLLIVGPPGTAKSAIVRRFAQLLSASFFDYLLTRFSEPNEIFGPVDIDALRKGKYLRRTEGMLPQAEIAFLDEIFKANSPVLNSLLTILNERRFVSGHEQTEVPLISLFGATNELNIDDSLQAVFDRFVLRVESTQLESHQFLPLLQHGLTLQKSAKQPIAPLASAAQMRRFQDEILATMHFSDAFLARYKSVVFQIRAEGVSFSDRRAVRLLKLMFANAAVDGRKEVDDGDLSLLRYVWNTLDQREIIEQILAPVLEPHYAAHPEQRIDAQAPQSLDALLEEVAFIRASLGQGEQSDIRLFAHLRSLGDLKAALQTMRGETAAQVSGEIEELLGQILASSSLG